MCHWVRDAEFERDRARLAVPPSEPASPRPRRLVGAVAAVAAVAIAALAVLFPAPTAESAAPPQAVAAPLQPTPHAALPAPPARRNAAAPDDGVPATSSQAAGSHCSQDL